MAIGDGLVSKIVGLGLAKSWTEDFVERDGRVRQGAEQGVRPLLGLLVTQTGDFSRH